MIKEIITYPAPLSVQYSTDVRVFNENIVSLIEDLKDTISEHNLEGLTAYQIGSYYNVVVIKGDDGELLELINPRLISHSGKITTTETTAYFPSLSAEITRYEDISIVYQDRFGKDCSLKASGKLAVLIQRKLDYTFGTTFLHKMSEQEKEKFQTKLEHGINIEPADYCPTTFKRDRILQVINIGMVLMLIALIVSFFISDTQTLATLWEYQLYGVYSLLVLNIGYFFYAQYEGKLYTSCSSCQLGNIIGTVTISLIKLSLITLGSYFLINPV
ncbi:MAG: peptide deformylase [Campylobacterota bacterium]|nr:peptide deformylase [Campylobacterota bacterium]